MPRKRQNAKFRPCCAFRAWYGDFVIAGRGDSACVAFAGNVEFNTSDESDTGRTITLNAKTRNEYSGKTVTVSGKGTLQVNNGCSNLAQPSVYVKDYATLAFGENGNLGTGDIQLCRETTLALTRPSGSHAFTKLANKLMLPTESGKVANIRIDGARLDAGTHEIADIKSSGTVIANVALDPYSTSLAGRKASLRVEDGKLYLEVLSTGLMVIIR